jgi:hypothetical protein
MVQFKSRHRIKTYKRKAVVMAMVIRAFQHKSVGIMISQLQIEAYRTDRVSQSFPVAGCQFVKNHFDDVEE